VLLAGAGRTDRLFYGERRHLSAEQTDALLSGRLDPLADFAALAAAAGARPPERQPWGYTQIVHRSALGRARYTSAVNHFATSDEVFVADLRRRGIAPELLPGLYCLHLDHAFAWYGTDRFL